jgi:hypothetical protein
VAVPHTKSKWHLMSETHRIREAQRGAEGRGNANETETVDAQRIEPVEDEARQAGTTEGDLRNPNGEATAKNRKRSVHLAPRAEYAVCARTAHRDVSSPVHISRLSTSFPILRTLLLARCPSLQNVNVTRGYIYCQT